MRHNDELKELAETIDRVALAMALLAEEYALEAMRLKRKLKLTNN